MLFTQLLEHYSDSALAVFAADLNFNLTYCNSSARSSYPFFSTPEGFKSMFSEKERDGISKILELTPSITAEGTDPILQGTFFCITRIKNDGYILIPDATTHSKSVKAKEIIDTLSPVFMSETNDILSYADDGSEKSRRIKTSAYRLKRFCTNVSKYKLLSAIGPTQNSYIDCSLLMRQVGETIKKITARTAASFSYKVGCKSAPILCNAEDLAYAVCQLISNSIKFSHKSVFIEMTLDVIDGKAVITVRDNGLGMKKDVLSRCTEPYYTYSVGRETNISAGLGLPIVKLVSVMYGGKLNLTSNTKKGTVATITFPCDTENTSFASGEVDYKDLCRKIVPIGLADSVNIFGEEEEIL